MPADPTPPPAPPIEVLRAARDWATEHRHQIPDDRLTEIAFAAGLAARRTAAAADLPLILAAIDNALRNGSYMTGANLALEMLCDHLDVDRDGLVFRPDWAAGTRITEGTETDVR
jgi:hypothetical protein